MWDNENGDTAKINEVMSVYNKLAKALMSVVSIF